MKKTLWIFYIICLMAFFFIAGSPEKIHAIQGELNYDIALPKQTEIIVTKDSYELDKCQKKVSDADQKTLETSKLLSNCQQANDVIKSSLEDKIKNSEIKNKIYLLLIVIMGILTILSFAATVLLLLKKKGATSFSQTSS